ncbi:MAG: gamma-glutamylcyclotransferase family protein, partial [Candidatus Caldarchaeum sp.]
KGFKLVFDIYSSSWRGGVADVVEDESGIVYGAAYLLDEEQLEKLDRYEGVPHLYHRRKVVIEVEGAQVEAFIYVGSSPRPSVKPSAEYVALMVKGLKRIGHGDEALKAVREAAESRP